MLQVIKKIKNPKRQIGLLVEADPTNKIIYEQILPNVKLGEKEIIRKIYPEYFKYFDDIPDQFIQ